MSCSAVVEDSQRGRCRIASGIKDKKRGTGQAGSRAASRIIKFTGYPVPLFLSYFSSRIYDLAEIATESFILSF